MLFHELQSHFLIHPDKTFFRIKRGLRDSVWTGRQILTEIEIYRHTLHALGLRRKDTIILWGQNMPEWSICFFACIASGIVVVPADPRTTWQTVLKYCTKVKPKCIVVSQLLVPLIKNRTYNTVTLEQLLSSSSQTKQLPYTPHELVEIVFTSGSSGDPKGVMITQKNILAQIQQTPLVLPPLPRFETISLLPLSHVYEQMYGLFMPIIMNGTINYLPRINPLTIKKALQRYKATYLIVVPQLLRILFDGIERTAHEQGKLQQFHTMLSAAQYVPIFVRRLLFAQVHKKFGGSLQFLASGSAPLEPKLAQYWEALGFTIVEGYGATETTGMATIQHWNRHTYGNVGTPTKHARVTIDQTGEICIQGNIVSPGYFHDTQKTAEMFHDGWYRTGDAGAFTQNKELVITGRHSSRIIMSDGTKIYPEDIERELNNFSEVKDSCVVGIERNHNIELHAYILPKKKSSVESLRQTLNTRLEDRQQIYALHTWVEQDFPRLRTLKIDRKAVLYAIQTTTKQHVPSQKTIQGIDTTSLSTILQTCTGKHTITPKDRIGMDLHLDSLGRLQLASLLEEKYGIEIQDLTLSPQTTVEELVGLINTQSLQTQFRAQDIVEHWRFSSWMQHIRTALKYCVVFPLYKHWVSLSVTKGKGVLQNIPTQSIIIFNHIGMFDAVGVSTLVPHHIQNSLTIPVTNERWDDGNKIISFLIDTLIGGYPFAREGARLRSTMEATGELADRGYSFILAPEGTMQREQKMQQFKTGLGYLAKELQLPIVMVKFADSYRDIWPAPPPGVYATASKYYFPKKKGIVGVHIGLATFDKTQSIENITKDIEAQFLFL